MNEEVQRDLKIAVCIKQVPDPEGPPASYEVDSQAMQVTPKGIPPVVSSFDENALEMAIRLKETVGGYITLISLGKGISQAVMLKALACGADELLILEDETFDRELLQSFSTAFLLAQAIRKKGLFDLILCGRQASDTNAGQVGLGLAQLLSIPAVSLVRKVTVDGMTAKLERVLPDGYEIVEISLPALLTVGSEAGDLRYPSLADIKQSKRKVVTRWNASDLGAGKGKDFLRLVALFPPKRERQCRIIEADSPEEAGEKLAMKLREDKVL
jgi:electron transfer flavoprotein beta subunit